MDFTCGKRISVIASSQAGFYPCTASIGNSGFGPSVGNPFSESNKRNRVKRI